MGRRPTFDPPPNTAKTQKLQHQHSRGKGVSLHRRRDNRENATPIGGPPLATTPNTDIHSTTSIGSTASTTVGMSGVSGVSGVSDVSCVSGVMDLPIMMSSLSVPVSGTTLAPQALREREKERERDCASSG